MIDEDLITKKASQEISSTMQRIYHPEQSEEAKLNTEKIALRRRLAEIQAQENKENPQIIEMKKQQLHRAIVQHQREKALSNNQINLFYQNTSQGKISWGGI